MLLLEKSFNTWASRFHTFHLTERLASHCLFILTCYRSFQFILASCCQLWPTWSPLSWSRPCQWHIQWFHLELSSRGFDECWLPFLHLQPEQPRLKLRLYFSYIDKNNLCLVHFSELVLPAGERTPGPNPFNPFNPLMLFRPPPAWGSNPPFPNCKQICIVDWWVADN